MAAFNKINSFVGALGLGYHGNLNTNQLNVALARATDPPTAADTVLADITQPTGTGYAVIDTQNTYSATAGTGTLVGTMCVFTAGAGDWQSFQYVMLYNLNSTTQTNALVCWWDYTTPLTLGNGETFSVKFNNSATTGNILTIA